MITNVAFIAHPARNMDAMRRFFGELLGLKNSANFGELWWEYDTPEGKTIACDGYSPEGTLPYLALETDGIEAEVARLKELGVTVIKDVWDNQVCKMAIITDPEGHGLMLHQVAPEILQKEREEEAKAAKARTVAKARPRKKAPAVRKAKPAARKAKRVARKAKPVVRKKAPGKKSRKR